MSSRHLEEFLGHVETVPELARQVHALLEMGEAAAETVARLAADHGFPCRPEDVLAVMAGARGSRGGGGPGNRDTQNLNRRH